MKDYWIVFCKLNRRLWGFSFTITFSDIIISLNENGFEDEFIFWLELEEYENGDLTYESIIALAFRYSKKWSIYN